MDKLESERQEALDYLTDCYARSVLDLRQYEDRRDQVMAARTSREILTATTDITVSRRTSEPETVPAGGEGGEVCSVLCIMGDRTLAPDTLAEPVQSTCIMGDVKIDLRNTARAGTTDAFTINTLTIMGDTVIRVHADAVVHNDITAIMADVKDRDRKEEPRDAPGGGRTGPTIRLTGLALMADVKIKRV